MNWLVLLHFLAGLVILVVGADVSPLLIGLAVVAAGTSAPEIATSVIATLRGERDIAVGNVVGSCLSHLLLVLGLCALICWR